MINTWGPNFVIKYFQVWEIPAKTWLFLTNGAVKVNEDILKAKENFAGNHAHNILRLLDILPNFPFTISENVNSRNNRGICELPYKPPEQLKV